ncbi:hypothetical protein QQF64_007887 [Cirrhinus molitorella]|uniref:ribonuclease H n=1 Tax=Cirrhinus molitorella TaxID=172907 RepID=A0ABR3M4M9_9TELE
MPFGLCNAPATFQRLMGVVLGDLMFDILLIYLDDVIIFSRNFESHCQRLEIVFNRLRQHGLKLKPTKCFLLKPEVKFLGHLISSEGIKLARPLHALVGKGGKGKTVEPLNWTTERQTAFDQLKQCLMSPPVLAYPDFSQSFVLTTNGSLHGLGAVLSQRQGGAERVIAYASRGLRGSEKNDKNYSAFKLELLALKWAVTKKCKEYLIYSKFSVITDHNPLRFLATANLGAVEQRWIAQLAEFNFEVYYKPGRQNTNADVLSRIPSLEEPEQEDSAKDFIKMNSDEVRACLWPAVKEQQRIQASVQVSVTRKVPGYSWSDIEEQQKIDPHIAPIYRAVLTNKNLSLVEQRNMDVELKKLARQECCSVLSSIPATEKKFVN